MFLQVLKVWIFLVVCLPTPTDLTKRKVEQRTVLKFLCKTGATPIGCWRQMKQVFGDQCMSQTRVRIWFKRFKLEGRDSTQDDQRPGRKKTTGSRTNVDRVRHALAPDRRKTVRMLSAELDLPRSGVHCILKKDLYMSKVAPKLVPKLLTPAQEEFCRCICTANLSWVSEDDTLLSRVVTGDESWVSVREVEMKQKSLEWIPKGSPGLRPVKARRQRAVRKLMLTVFWDELGPILIDFLPPGEVVDSDRYVEVLTRLREAIRRKRPHLWMKDPDSSDTQQRRFVIHHDNASSHTSCITLAFFQHIPLLAHPPYSPDLAPSDFFLFPRLKTRLATNNIRTLDELRASVVKELKAIPKEDYRAALQQQLPLRWMKCLAANGSYFEGRHFPVDPEQHGLVVTFDDPEESPDEQQTSSEESD